MYILTLPHLKKSAKLIAKNLSDRTGKRIEVHVSPQLAAPLIRWGSVANSYEQDTKLNSRKSIRFSGSKLACSNLLSTTDLKYVEIQSGIPERYPVVVRTTLTGMGGAGIIVARDEREFQPYKDEYWSYYHNFSYEVGAHMLGGQLVKLFKKTWNRSEDEPRYPIRNLERGYGFRKVGFSSQFSALKDYISSLYDVLGIEMGRADIGWDSVDRCYRLIEMNTAPGLSNNDDTLGMYTDFLYERIFV